MLAAATLLGLVLVPFAFSAKKVDEPQPMNLWPREAPGETNKLPAELDTRNAHGDVAKVTNVSIPTLTVYKPDAAKDTHTAVIVCPGGGYQGLAYDYEGSDICKWLNTLGVTGVLLKYRVPSREGMPRYAAALQDAQRAIATTRANADLWHINPKMVGILGFSAGGHLSATASTNYDKRSYDRIDPVDDQDLKPNFTVLIYPAYLVVDPERTTLAPEIRVDSSTPPAFVVQTDDDPLGAECSMIYALALRKAKIPVELHIYPKGGHGYGMKPSPNPVSHWPDLLAAWMKSQGYLAQL